MAPAPTLYSRTATASFGSPNTPPQPFVAGIIHPKANHLHAIADGFHSIASSSTVGGSHSADSEDVSDTTGTATGTDHAFERPVVFVGGQPIPMNLGDESSPKLGKRRIAEEAQSVLVNTIAPYTNVTDPAIPAHNGSSSDIATPGNNTSVGSPMDADLSKQPLQETLHRIEKKLKHLQKAADTLYWIMIFTFIVILVLVNKVGKIPIKTRGGDTVTMGGVRFG